MKHLLAAAAAAAVLLSGGSALAQSIGTTLDATDAQATFPKFRNNLANCQVNMPQSRYYELGTLTVSATGNYAFADTGGTVDAILGIYSGPFNPADPTQGCVIGIDDGGGSQDGSSVTLTAGTYTVMFASYSDDAVGVVNYAYTGPGTLTVGPYVAPASVPTLSEWAMILFGAVLAGGAAVMVERRRRAA